MEIAICEIWFIQERRLELTCVSFKKLGWLQLYKPTGDKGRERHSASGDLPLLAEVAVTALVRSRDCNGAYYINTYI